MSRFQTTTPKLHLSSATIQSPIRVRICLNSQSLLPLRFVPMNLSKAQHHSRQLAPPGCQSSSKQTTRRFSQCQVLARQNALQHYGNKQTVSSRRPRSIKGGRHSLLMLYPSFFLSLLLFPFPSSPRKLLSKKSIVAIPNLNMLPNKLRTASLTDYSIKPGIKRTRYRSTNPFHMSAMTTGRSASKIC